MCGITGAVIKDSNNVDKYWDLLRVSDIRGQDGTGISWCNKEEGVLHTKRWESKARLISDSEFFNLKKGDAIIGQNRLAVFGLEHKDDQPIISNRFALVHNGNLTQFEEKFKLLNLKRELSVDSELIFRILESEIERVSVITTHPTILRFHIVEYIKHLYPRFIKGNYACLFLDVRNLTFYAFTKYKPLFSHVDTYGNIFFFSTEKIGEKVFSKNVKFTSIDTPLALSF